MTEDRFLNSLQRTRSSLLSRSRLPVITNEEIAKLKAESVFSSSYLQDSVKTFLASFEKGWLKSCNFGVGSGTF